MPTTFEDRLLDALLDAQATHAAPSAPTTRRLVRRSALVGAAAVAVTAVAVLTAGPRSDQHHIAAATSLPAVEPIAAINQALSATDDTVLHIHQTGPDDVVDTWWDGPDGDRSRIVVNAPDGTPEYDLTLTRQPDGTTTALQVDHAVRQWFDGAPTDRDVHTMWPDVRAALADGSFTLVGPTTLEGRAVVEVERVGSDGKGTTHLWADADTYLPVHSTYVTADGATTWTADFEWLPADAANRAQLDPVVPPGFTEVEAP
jgi:hypothetical protein